MRQTFPTGGASCKPPACTNVWGVFYAPRSREGKQILPHDTSKSVETIRGYTTPLYSPMYPENVNHLKS
jgi:hypothetical protein